MSLGGPPPPQWSSDVLRNISNSQDVMRQGSTKVYDALALSEAARHVRAVGDSRRDADLYDMLANTRREETYQPYFAEWPSLLRTMSPTISDMPRMVQEKYRTCQTMCFCGLFPQIQHAWASIDNSLYLWRYDRSNDVPVEYCGEEQAICAVGLVRPRAGVFLEAIEYVIVLCTTTEIVMVGVCPTRRGADSLDPSNAPSLALQPLPMYSLPSDNVVMTCVASSPSTGRIFLGGSDGHLYELQYAAAESWVRKRCTKIRLTGKFVQMLPSFIPALLGYGASGSVDKVVLDDQRHTLYVLINQGYLQVFDLGSSGADPAKKVAEVADFYQAAAGASGGRDVFRNAAGEKKSAAVKHITPIPLSESSKLHLLAITADGRRVYFTTHMLRQSYYTPAYQPATNSSMIPQAGQAPPPPRPVTLMAVFSRQALPHAGVSLSRSQADLARPAALEVMIAHYSQGTLLLSEAAGSDGRTTKLLVACRNATLPQASTNLGSSTGAGGGVSHAGLRELLSELGTSVPGETCAIEALPSTANGLELLPEAHPGSGTVGGLPGAHDDLAAQLFRAPPRFVLISTAGVVRLERRRPLEILSVLLEERVTKQVNQFFEAYGAPEAAAMCLALASTPPGTLLTAVVDNATACLDNPALVGEARMPQDVPQMEAGPGAFGMGATNGIFMGQAVNPHPEPDWSAGHQGLCLYVSRLTSPVWEVRLVGAAGGDISGLLVLRLPRPATEALLGKLRQLEVFLGDYIIRKQARGSQSRYTPVGGAGQYALPKGFGAGYMGNAQDDAANAHAKRQRLVHASTLEDDRTQRLRHLVAKSAQALALMHVLADNNLGRIAVSLTDTQRTQLQGLTLRDLVCDSEGEQLASQLINVLVNQYLDASTSGAAAMGPVSGVEGVVAILQKQCPAFFKEEDRKFYQASAQLKAAQSESPGPERNSMVKKALEVLREVPALANLESLTSQLAYLKAYAEVLDVPLAAAAAQDPANAALRPEMGPEYESARQRRRDAYRAVLNMLRQLCAGTGNPAAAAAMAAGVPQAEAAVLSSTERSTAVSSLLKACFQASDVFFHQCLYETLIEEGESATLLANNPPHLQAYLASESGLAGGLESARTGAEPPPVGPLSPQQCKLAELLAKLFVSLRRFREAAAVYKCLAVRRAGPGTQAVPLAQRVTFLQAAVLQARSAGDSTQVTSLEADLKSMTLQATTAERVQTLRAACPSDSPEAAELSRQETELCSRLIDVSSLYNDVAQPLRLWDICLQIVDFAGGSGVEAAVVRQLWDHVLMAALDGGDNGIRSAGAAASGTQGGLAGAASVVERLGAQFYPNQHSCPLPYVVFRLVQISCGRWPGSSSAPSPSPSAGEEVVARAVLSASGGTVTQALRCFELLLTRRAPDVPEQELAPLPMRLAVLRCLAQLCKVAYSEVGSALISPGLAPAPSGAASAPGGLSPVPGAVIQREAGGLADACERFGLEAKRLGTPDAAELAESFAAVRQAVQQRLGSRW